MGFMLLESRVKLIHTPAEKQQHPDSAVQLWKPFTHNRPWEFRQAAIVRGCL